MTLRSIFNFLAPRRQIKLTALLAIFASTVTYYVVSPPKAQGLSSTVVISQVYGGAGCGTAGCSTYKNDYIELHNRGASPVSLNGWSVQYASAAGTGWTVTPLTNVTLQPGQYYLVAEGSGPNGVNNLPTPDATGSIAMSATAAKVALVNSTTALSGACPSGANIIDLVGYGSGVSCFEGTATAPAPSTTTADIRGANGCTETDNNSTDFATGTPNPRNTASAVQLCSESTNPTGTGAANPNSVVAGNSTLLTVTVTPGASPTSTGLAVTADLTSIGGSAAQGLGDDGANGDATAGDNIFSYQATVPAATVTGVKTIPATIIDAQSRSGSATISLTVSAATAPLSGTGSANPSTVQAGDSTTLTVQVIPATSPASTGLAVVADLSSIGGSAAQSFNGVGNTFTYPATVAGNTISGTKTLPVTITDAQSRSFSTNITLSVQALVTPTHIVISQIYGGGGNSGATFSNDYVELYNPTAAPVTITGWSLQYGAATGTTWTNKQPLGGIIGPGEYYLVQLASGGATGGQLPPANISGDLNLSATAGKIALVRNGDALPTGCPIGVDPDIIDFVGYGATANCFEGSAKAPAASNTTALFRKASGLTDTDQNGADFITGAPNPRRTAPIVELGPWVASTEPITNGTNAPYDATITVNFSEPVNVDNGWYRIVGTLSGTHTSATIAPYDSSKGFQITPNDSFQFGEQVTVTIFKDKIHDQDLDDSAPDTDNLFENYSWTFTVAGAGQPAPYPPSVHLTMGNPSNATPFLTEPNNYLMVKPTYALSYNRDKGTPNWVSWHLDQSWFGNLTRVDTFRADPKVPADWYRVQSTDYFTTGFDRGHMTPNADRDNENRIPINQETYLMSNMVPQAPDNNQGPWANFENYLRSILTVNGVEQEIYIVSGPYGIGGTGSNGGLTNTIANGRVTVPAYTWKIALILPKGEDDLSRVTCSARTIAILMPNVQGIRNDDWQNYLTSIDAIEALTGYNFFSNLPEDVQSCIEAGVNGANPPGTANQTATTTEDTSVNITLHALRPDQNALTFSVVGAGPQHGTLGNISAATCTGGECTAIVTYTPNTDYNGTDSFVFKAGNGATNSNQATVSISVTEVNDPVTATADSATTSEDTALNIAAANLTTNDSAGPANESSQTLTVTGVTATANTHGSVTLTNGTIAYVPDANYSGLASFTYQVCDNGTTNGAPDFKCAIGTVNVNVVFVPDTTPPTISCIGDILVDFDPAVNGAVVTYTAPAGSDNRPGATTTQIAGLPSGATFQIGTTINTFRVTDAAGNSTSCSFKVTVAPTSLIGLDSVSMTGTGYTDSYSSNGGYPSTKGSLANVVSNGTITIGNSSKVWGSVRSTRAGINLSGASSVTGNATAGTTVTKSGSAAVGGTITNNALAPLITVPVVATCGPPYSTNGGIRGTYSYNSSTGDLTLSGMNVATLANGTYCFHNLTLLNSAQLKVNGPVVIKLAGTLNIGGATVINNTTGVPGNLKILSSYSGAHGITIGNGTSIYMVLYAPQTSVTISGAVPLFGTVAAKSLVIGKGGVVHYDISLKNIWPGIWSAVLGL